MMADEVELMPGVYLTRNIAPPSNTSSASNATSSTSTSTASASRPVKLSATHGVPVSDDVYGDEMDPSYMLEEIARLRSNVEKLLRSNAELREFMETDPDEEYRLAIEENVTVIDWKLKLIKTMELKVKAMLSYTAEGSRGCGAEISGPKMSTSTTTTTAATASSSLTQPPVNAPSTGTITPSTTSTATTNAEARTARAGGGVDTQSVVATGSGSGNNNNVASEGTTRVGGTSVEQSGETG
ncbi:hypothetical protein HDU76_005210, partial [Blyttiomyces sp. JEL0837]